MILVKRKYQSNRNQDKRNAWWIFFEVPFIKVLGNTYWWTPNCLAWREKKVDCFTLSYKYSSKEQDLCFQAWGEWLRLYDCLGIWIISKTAVDSLRILNMVSCCHFSGSQRQNFLFQREAVIVGDEFTLSSPSHQLFPLLAYLFV